MRSIQLPVLALWVGQSTSEQKCADETTLLQGLKKMQDSVRRFNSELGIDTMPIPGNNPCHSRSEPVESPQLGRDFHFLFSGQKCPHRHSDRLFRKPETGSNHDSFTVEACYRFCAEHENCNYFSFGDHNGGKVCMGCVSLQNAQIHDGFDVYDMVSTEAETAVDVMEWNDTRSVADAVTAVAGPLVHVLIDNSNENTKCVTAPVPVICADNAGHFGNRLNTHTAGDEFEIRVDGAEVCATRTDSSNGWGMHLEIACAAAPVHILIDRSSENTKCVRHSFPVSCAGDSGNLDNRINSHQAGDTFDITTSVDLIGPKICATRTDSGAGWGMRLEIACVAASGEELQGQIVATPAINILIDNSNENIKCVEASLPVICAGDAGQLGNRINSHNAGDTFEITTDGTQVCARRTDSTNGWGMHLEITCMAAPVRVLIDSSGENTKCVTASYPVTCADDAGHLGSRVNSHQADDTFEITSNGVEVCATRTDAPVGWGMHLEIVCVATAGMGIWDGNGTCADQGRYIRHDVGTAIYWEKCGVKYWVQSCSMCDNILDFAHTPCHNHWVDQPQSYIDSLLTGGGFRSADGERFQCSQHWAYNTAGYASSCGTAPNIPNAALGTSQPIGHGMSASYECLEGFELGDSSRSFEIICHNGVFGIHSLCAPVSCGTAPTIENAIVGAASKTVSYPYAVEYECRSGFTVDGSISSSFEISCQADGSFTQGGCVPVECPAVPTLTNAEWTIESQSLIGASIVSFSVLQYRCLEGFAFAGLSHGVARNLECGANGQYSALRTCAPINDCLGHTCGPFGVCRDLHMDYTCECVQGYEIQQVQGVEGAQELMCGNVDDCHGVQCGEGGTCEDQVDDYACNCRRGFQEVELANSKTCERLECGVPPTIENAMRAIAACSMDGGGKALFEDVVAYHCLPGFSVSGQHDGLSNFEVACQDDGAFSLVSACIPVECGQPPQVAHATVSAGAISYPNAADYQCNVGYTTTGTASGAATFQKSCTDSGVFLTLSNGQAVATSCRPVSCGTPPGFAMATVSSSAVHTFGEVAAYTCSEGYALEPNNPSANTFTSECRDDGSWGEVQGSCSPVTCTLPDDVDLLASFGGSPTSAGQVVSIADVTMTVTYRCKDGYTVDGHASSVREQVGVCNAQGMMTVSACVPVTCAYSSIVHGARATIVGEAQDFTFGETASLRCNAGWEVAPALSEALASRIRSPTEFVVSCLATGQFSSPLYCQNIDDCEGHTCGSHGICVDGLEDYSCNCREGFEESVVDGQKVCGNIDDCNGVSCGPAGTCTDQVGSFTCECGLGHDNEGGNPNSPCVPNTCNLPILEGTQMLEATTLSFQQVAQIHCVEGYTTSVGEHFSVQCTADGSIAAQDEDELQVCVPKSCGAAPSLTLVRLAPDRGHDFLFGETARYVCQGGAPEIEFQCGADGWIRPSGAFESCENSCGLPNEPINGPLGLRLQQAVSHPNSVQLGCQMGFTHLASGVFSEETLHLTQDCLATGEWAAWGAEVSTTDGRLTCIPVRCERTDLPAHWHWADEEVFDFTHPAMMMCDEGYSLNGMLGGTSSFAMPCSPEGSLALIAQPCQPISLQITGDITDAVTGQLMSGVTAVVTDSSGLEHTTTSNGFGIYYIEGIRMGEITITVSLDGYTTWEYTMNLQDHVFHGPLDVALNPHLEPHSWRAVLTWAVHPRDLDGHVTRHAVGPDGPTLMDPNCGVCGHSTERTHLYWRQKWMRSTVASYFSSSSEDTTKPAARLDRDSVDGNGIPETITFFRMDTCQYDCDFVYRVWDYCSLPDAMVDESEALVRLYNSDGLHSTYTIAANGNMHSADGYLNRHGFTSFERRWDVFKLDASGGEVRVVDCSSGNCPPDLTYAPTNHGFC